METQNDRIKRAKKWLEEYVEGFMFTDITACIRGNANYAAALALSVYTEVLGGLITSNLGDTDIENYRTFLQRMGYSKDEAGRIYGLTRCGLVHQYFIKRNSTVHMWKPGTKGIVVSADRVDFYVVSYYQEFQVAYCKYKAELLGGSKDLLDNLEKATSQREFSHQSRVVLSRRRSLRRTNPVHRSATPRISQAGHLRRVSMNDSG